jgi:hypothetical protein
MNRLLKGRLLKGVVCVGLWLGLAIKSDVNGMMIDTSKSYVKVTPATMGVTATGFAGVSIDLKEIGIVDKWAFSFTDGNGKFASDAARTKVIKPVKSVGVKVKVDGLEIKNSNDKTVAYAGLYIETHELNADGKKEKRIDFTKDKDTKLLWVLYKEGKKSGGKFVAGDELPTDWVEGADGNLTCAMTVNVVAAK